MSSKTSDRESFCNQFKFNPNRAGHLGMELELWTMDPTTKKLIPSAIELFKHYNIGQIKPELPAHQIELNTLPCKNINDLEKELHKLFAEVKKLEQQHSFKAVACPLPPSDFDLIVYPYPRYIDIAKKVPAEILRNGWIAGCHIHFGLSNWPQAFRTLKHLTTRATEMTTKAKVNETRLETYKKMAPDRLPPVIETKKQFYEIACAQGFDQDPRRCWWLIRINPVGTLEVRLFDSSDNIDELLANAKMVKDYCLETIKATK